MAHELVLIKGNKKQNITQLVGNLAWSSNIDALGVELSFDYAFNDSRYFKSYDIVDIGDHVALFNQSKLISKFIVVDESTSGRFGKSYTGFDYSWYLNKNQTVIQFKKIAASQAIQKLLDKLGIKHNITQINTLITHIYKGETVSDIINDILEQATQETGHKYRVEMDKDVLTIKKTSDLVINPKVRLSSNTPEFSVVSAIGIPDWNRSIQEMKNNILVVNSNEDSTKVIASAKGADNIKRFGQLTEVVEVDEKNEAQARNIAKTKLSELNRIEETITLPLLGHDDIRAGRILNIDEPVTGIKGKYLIKSAAHTESNGIHLVTVELAVN